MNGQNTVFKDNHLSALLNKEHFDHFEHKYAISCKYDNFMIK